MKRFLLPRATFQGPGEIYSDIRPKKSRERRTGRGKEVRSEGSGFASCCGWAQEGTSAEYNMFFREFNKLYEHYICNQSDSEKKQIRHHACWYLG